MSWDAAGVFCLVLVSCSQRIHMVLFRELACSIEALLGNGVAVNGSSKAFTFLFLLFIFNQRKINGGCSSLTFKCLLHCLCTNI